MAYDAKIHHRKSIRYPKYDYAQDGAYFVTVCAQDMKCVFGEIQRGEMELNEAGKIARACWREIPKHYPFVALDEFVVMPNHIHGILWIVNRKGGLPHCRGSLYGRPSYDCLNEKRAGTRPAPTKTLGDVVGAFKSLTTNEYIRNVKMGKFPPFEKSIWQRNYWEHIIRDDDDLTRICEYIINNPLNWELDELYSCIL